MTEMRQWKWLYRRKLKGMPTCNVDKILKQECSCSLCCCTALAGEKFQRIIVPSSSGSNSHSFPTLVDLFDPEDEGITIL